MQETDNVSPMQVLLDAKNEEALTPRTARIKTVTSLSW
jgi:hypothetical protein